MSKVEFTVLQGGLHSSIPKARKRFLSAYVTNTRLMGVLALYAHWAVENGGDIHQFFYIDCEEAGLETCKVFRGDWNLDMDMAEQALVGGLGAEKIPLTAKAFRWLLNYWKEFNESRDLPLPAGRDNYEFIFNKVPTFSPEEEASLMESICGEVSSDYQVVNYFLMRCFGQDEPGAAYLAEDGVPLDIFSNYRKATFCKNTIDPGDHPHEYVSESLVEMGGKYETIITKIRVRNLKVAKFEYCSKAPVTATEAALMLRKTEFATVYELLMDDKDIEENLGEFVLNMNTVMTTHPNGRLFMAFKPTNSHVAERVFMLSNDVKGVYFLTNYGQLIACAYDHDSIIELERELASSPLRSYLMMTGQYELLDPVLFEFINSDYADFNSFIDPMD
jgi:hypothetical protein